jgi:hypothetical protein
VTDGPFIRTDASREGIIVTVSQNGAHASSGMAQIARHRPTRYSLMMRRHAANRARKAAGEQQFPAIMAGDCVPCAGLGVVGAERGRCGYCGGSGMR